MHAEGRAREGGIEADIGAIDRKRNGMTTAWSSATFFRTGTFGDRRYRREENWGGGDDRRLITIGSPFKGSPLANAIEPYLEPSTENFGWHALMAPVIGGLSMWSLLYPGGNTIPGNYIEPTTVADLAVNSSVQTLLENPSDYPSNHVRIPFAPVAGIATESVGNAPIQGALWELLFSFTPFLPENPFEIEPLSPANSDLMVPVLSQLNASGDLDYPNAALPWRCEFHTHVRTPVSGMQAETDSILISNQVRDLLSQHRAFFLNGVLY